MSEDTGFCSAPPLPSDAPDPLCDHLLPDSSQSSQEPQDELDPAPPPPPAIDTPPGSLCEEEEDVLTALPLPLPPGQPEEAPAAASPGGSVCEEDVTLALKELDERCEEEEADFSGMSR